MIPTNAKDALKNWDAGEIITTIEMGGLGPGYEQCIHVGIMEMLRELIGKDIPENDDERRRMFDDELYRINDEFDLELSGAQAGAIKSLVYQYLTKDWPTVLAMVSPDRHIQVSNHWPGKKQ